MLTKGKIDNYKMIEDFNTTFTLMKGSLRQKRQWKS